MSQKGQIQILIGILILVIIAGGAYFLGKSSGPKPSTPITSQTPQPTPSPTPDPTANWKIYTGKYVTFEYPPEWNPVEQELCCGAMLEDIKLNIPGVTSDQSIGFGSGPFSDLKINDAIREEKILIDGKLGTKNVRSGNITNVQGKVFQKYFVYDYCTSGPKNIGSFCLHIDSGQKNNDLEKQLDKVNSSILFK